MKNYDLIVVGAGPAGLAAAHAAAVQGLQTVLIERRKHLSPITRACLEGILVDEEYYGDSVSVCRESGSIRFKNSDLQIRYSGPVKEVPYFANVSANGGRMKLVRDGHAPIHLVYDKGRCLVENLDMCLQAGVGFRPDETVCGIEKNAHGVIVQTSREAYSARFLIAADGHNSVCARLAGFNRERKYYGTLMAACWHIKGFEPPEPAHIHLVEGGQGPAVFCLCPRAGADEYNVMVSSFASGYKYWEKFEQVKDNSVLSDWFSKKTEVIRQSACVLKLMGQMKISCRDNIFIVGDAAWMGQTSNTHAALCGVKAVDSICRALANGNPEEDCCREYRDWWNAVFVPGIRTPGVNIFEELEAEEIDALFSFMPDEIPGSLEPGRAQKLMQAFFQQLMPELREKNPGLFQRIMSIQRMDPDAVWQKRRGQEAETAKAQNVSRD